MSGKICADALDAIPLVNDSNVNDLDQLFLINFTRDSLVLFMLCCVCWRFSGKNCNNF